MNRCSAGMKRTAPVLALAWLGMAVSNLVSPGQVLREKSGFRPLTVSGASYYVSPEGDDSYPGTQASPWKTLRRAAEQAAPGDTVYLRDGVYTESLTLDRDGTPQGPIAFRAFPDERPVLQGPAFGEGTGVRIHGSYILISGLEIRNWELGIEMTGRYIEVSGCRVHNLVFGISPHDGCRDFRVSDVELFDFLLFGFDASRWGAAEPVCRDGWLVSCTAHDGLDDSQNVDGFALGDGSDIHFEDCAAYRVFDGFDIKADRTCLHRCVAAGCWNSGYKLWSDGIRLINCIGWDNLSSHVELDWDGQPGTASLWNCTFHRAHTFGIWVENSRDRLRMMNCILTGGSNIGLCFEQQSIGEYEGDHNLFHNGNPERAVVVGYTDEFSLDQLAAGFWTQYSLQDAASLVSHDPGLDVYLDLNGLDLHLGPGSRAIDRGTSREAPLVDFDCMQRPAGSGFDIGAFEFASRPAPECGLDGPETGNARRTKAGKHRK